MNLNDIGWKKYAAQVELPEGDYLVGRVAVENKQGCTVLTEDGERDAILRGKILSGLSELGFPKVGDWVRYSKLPNEDKVVIEEVLPRSGKISRKTPEDEQEQVIVANIDVVFIVQSLPDDFNLRRLERYLVIAKQGGAKPVVVINKIDLHDKYLEILAEAKVVAQDAPVIALSAKSGDGMDQLRAFLEPGSAFVFLGSSGVGKSSLINSLTGNSDQATKEIRDYDGRGRHTTTRREMIILKDGSILIDTPGMREVALWADESDVQLAFEDVEEIALQCKYSRCDHDKSAGCAIKEALDTGVLSLDRYQSYIKMRREVEFLESKGDKKKELARKSRTKVLHKTLHNRLKEKYTKPKK